MTNSYNQFVAHYVHVLVETVKVNSLLIIFAASNSATQLRDATLLKQASNVRYVSVCNEVTSIVHVCIVPQAIGFCGWL